VYDKTVRRRRAVLGLLVASSLILLTAYFGESAGGGLHSVQRGVLDMVAPVQDGASRVLKPVRDLFGWAGDTLHAKGQLKTLRHERDQLRAQAIQGQAAVRENRELRAQLKMNQQVGLDAYGPVQSRVIAQDPNLWFTQVTIDKGTSNGVHEDQPVLTGAGLIGRVTDAGSSSAVVTLITNHDTQVGATINDSSGVNGLLTVEAGRPTELVLGFVGNALVKPGQAVVTSGTVSKVGKDLSPYPKNIPVGRVTRVDNPDSDSQVVHVKPFADLLHLDDVEVLTKVHGSGG
jgi:rod shape-determining protein MreC